MDFTDRLTLDAPRKTRDGYVATSVRAARTGIQIYSGREVDPDNSHGMRDRQEVRVYRSPDEVFHKDSLATYAHRPVTVDHPPVPVNTENWRDYAVGQTDGEVLRDGDFVRVPMLIMDADAIKAVEGGKREISQGYGCVLDWTGGTTPSGEAYDCAQTQIRVNHTAIVDFARGGPQLKIGDSKKMRTILIDGHSVEVSDAAAIAIDGLNRQLADAQAKVATLTTAATTTDARLATLTTEVATKDAEIVTLKKSLADSKITPQMIRDAAASYAKTASIAKALGVTVTDAMDEPAIQLAAVTAKLGDAAKGWNDVQVAASFASLAATIPAGQIQTATVAVDSLRVGVAAITPTTDAVAEAAKARADRYNRLATGHLGTQPKAN